VATSIVSHYYCDGDAYSGRPDIDLMIFTQPPDWTPWTALEACTSCAANSNKLGLPHTRCPKTNYTRLIIHKIVWPLLPTF